MHETENGPRIGPQVIFGMDADGSCTLSIGPGLQDLGVRPHQLEGQNLFTVYRDDLPALASLRRVLDGETFTVEREFGGRTLSVFYQPVHDDQGRVTGAFGVTTDVTAQRRVERESERAQLRAGLLAELTQQLTREVLDLEALTRVMIRSVTEAVADRGIVWVRTADGERLTPRAAWGVADGQDDRDVLEASAVERMPAVQALDLRSVVRVPLRSRGNLVGLLEVTRGERDRFTDWDVDVVVDLADRCALALDNALLLEAHRNAHEELVKFHALAEASDNLIATADIHGRFTYVNPSVHALGVDLAGGDVWRAVTSQAGEAVATEIRDAVEARRRWSGDLTATFAGQARVGHLETFSLHHPETGSGLGTAWIAQDVTDLRQTEAALRAANADLKRFKALVEASPDFVAIASLDGRVEYVNPAGRELVGMPLDADVSRTTIADYLTPEGLEQSVQREQPAVIANGHWEGESTLRHHAGGPPIPVVIASFLMRDVESGEPFALATVQRDISERLAAEQALLDLAGQREALLTRLVDAQEEERTRIAADVHDDPVQACSALELRLGLLRHQIEERAPELVEGLDDLQASVAGATERLRTLLFDLEPPNLGQGLATALTRAAEEIFDGAGVQWSVHGENEPAAPNATRAIAYRIAKEALHNARKHARAEHVTVTVTDRDGGIEVVVEDDGVGIETLPAEPSPGHRGVSSMQDRAMLAGGRCSISEDHGDGTEVRVWLPVTHLAGANALGESAHVHRAPRRSAGAD